MTTGLTLFGTTAALTLSLGLFGCAADDDLTDEEFNDADAIAASLELDNGGLDMEDEAPLFAQDLLFEDSNLVEEDVAYRDAIERDTEVSDMLRDVDAAVYHTTVMWGQIPGNRDNDTPYDWSGSLSVNRGAIVVRRVLAFDRRVDRLVPRTDRRVVSFQSATWPHHDGLRLVIVDPDPGNAEPLTLTYAQRDGDSFSAAMNDIVREPQSREMDDAGNRIVAVAMRRAVDVCESGFLRGRWHQVTERRGRILGSIADAEGNLLGHLRGLYGHRRDGEPVFFIKAIGRDGGFRGIMRGTYGEGHFLGRWFTRDGERGVVGGEYRETIPGPRTGGHFLGRWAERTCNVDIRG